MSPKNAVVKKDKAEAEVLTAQEVKKIDDAVKFINKQANAPAKSLLDIGKYLLENFFDDDPQNVNNRAPRKGFSLRRLSEHPDIAMNHQTLSNAVKLAVQEDLFKSDKYKALTESHKLLLFKLGDDDKAKLKFADKVLKENLSVRKLHNVLVGANLIAQRGRPELSDGSPPDLFSSFMNPIERLANFDITIDPGTAEKLTNKQLEALTALKEKIEKLIELRSKAKK